MPPSTSAKARSTMSVMPITRSPIASTKPRMAARATRRGPSRSRRWCARSPRRRRRRASSRRPGIANSYKYSPPCWDEHRHDIADLEKASRFAASTAEQHGEEEAPYRRSRGRRFRWNAFARPFSSVPDSDHARQELRQQQRRGKPVNSGTKKSPGSARRRNMLEPPTSCRAFRSRCRDRLTLSAMCWYEYQHARWFR